MELPPGSGEVTELPQGALTGVAWGGCASGLTLHQATSRCWGDISLGTGKSFALVLSWIPCL